MARKVLSATCVPQECIRRIKRASETHFAFMPGRKGPTGEKVVAAHIKKGIVQLRGRYGYELAKGFLIRLDARLEASSNGGTRLICDSRFILPVRVFGYVWFSVVAAAGCLVSGVALFGPVKPAPSQTLGALGTVAAMLVIFAVIMSFVRYVAGRGEEEYLLGCLSQAVERE